MKVYLAGTLREEMWRDPFRFGAPQHQYLDPSTIGDIWAEDQYSFLDLEMVRASDLVVAYASPSNKSLYGTSLEIGYAYGLGIPVVLIDALSPAADWRASYFGMHRTVAQVVVSTVDEAVALLSRLPGDAPHALFNPVRSA